MSQRTSPSLTALIENARGLAIAAFLPAASIAKMLGCSDTEAGSFQDRAISDFVRLTEAVASAKAARQ